MKTRIITAIVALLVLIPVLIFATFEIIWGITVLRVALALISAIAIFEAAECVGAKKPLLLIPSLLAGVLLILTTKDSLAHYTPIMILLLFVLLFIGVLAHKSIKSETVLPLFAFVFYIVVSFGALLLVFERYNGFYFPLIFLGAWVTDTFAYFTGRLNGKHKLCPAVSPKKTIEGSIGGIVFSAGVAVLFGVILESFELIGASNLILLAVAGALLSIASQIGDLTASLLKREYDLKDYGALFPGHGGVLDRFDSVIAVAPLLLLFMTLIGDAAPVLGEVIIWL